MNAAHYCEFTIAAVVLGLAVIIGIIALVRQRMTGERHSTTSEGFNDE